MASTATAGVASVPKPQQSYNNNNGSSTSSNSQQHNNARAIRGAGGAKKLIDFTEDSVGGRQYTNFERRPRGNRRADSKYEKVEPIPDDVESVEVKIDPDNCVCFSGRSHWLSNFYRAPMSIDGHSYASVEHYYQACKLYMLGGARFSNQIRRIPDAGSCKVTARRLLKGVATDAQIDEWKMRHSPHILQHAMINKFVQHPNLRQQLLDTGEGLLAHTYELDGVFAAGMNKDQFLEWAKENNGTALKLPSALTPETLPFYPLIGGGKNLLGIIIGRARTQIRQFQEKMNSGLECDDPVLVAAMAALKLQPTEPKEEKPESNEKSPVPPVAAPEE